MHNLHDVWKAYDLILIAEYAARKLIKHMRDPKSREKYPNIRGHSTTLLSSKQNSYIQYKKHVKQGGTRGGHATRVQNLIHTLFKISSIYNHPPHLYACPDRIHLSTASPWSLSSTLPCGSKQQRH